MDWDQNSFDSGSTADFGLMGFQISHSGSSNLVKILQVGFLGLMGILLNNSGGSGLPVPKNMTRTQGRLSSKTRKTRTRKI